MRKTYSIAIFFALVACHFFNAQTPPKTSAKKRKARSETIQERIDEVKKVDEKTKQLAQQLTGLSAPDFVVPKTNIMPVLQELKEALEPVASKYPELYRGLYSDINQAISQLQSNTINVPRTKERVRKIRTKLTTFKEIQHLERIKKEFNALSQAIIILPQRDIIPLLQELKRVMNELKNANPEKFSTFYTYLDNAIQKINGMAKKIDTREIKAAADTVRKKIELIESNHPELQQLREQLENIDPDNFSALYKKLVPLLNNIKETVAKLSKKQHYGMLRTDIIRAIAKIKIEAIPTYTKKQSKKIEKIAQDIRQKLESIKLYE